MLLILILFVSFYGYSALDTNICENNATTLACPNGQTVCIISSNYGRRDSKICPQKGLDSNTNCSSTNSTNILKQRCSGLQNCTISASNQVFGDPCVGTYKYLEVNYTCCINASDIPSNCSKNEIYTYSNPCFESCRRRLFCPFYMQKRCTCKKGYKRDIRTGNCVLEKYCPLSGSECATHETFSECGAGCQKTCQNMTTTCSKDECTPGYICNGYYIRDTITGKCIYPFYCNRRDTFPF